MIEKISTPSLGMRKTSLKQNINQTLSASELVLAHKTAHRQAIGKASLMESLISPKRLEEAAFYRLPPHLSREQRQAVDSSILLAESEHAQDLFAPGHPHLPDLRHFIAKPGATDRMKPSSTHQAEKQTRRRRITAKPGEAWHQDLKHHHNCQLGYGCIAALSGMKAGLMPAASDPNDKLSSHGLPSIASVAESGNDHRECRMRNAKTYAAQPDSPNDLLTKHPAPAGIDCLSIRPGDVSFLHWRALTSAGTGLE